MKTQRAAYEAAVRHLFPDGSHVLFPRRFTVWLPMMREDILNIEWEAVRARVRELSRAHATA
eukprot:6845081-Alexandrium_andersonii.AAC.1